MKRGAKPAPGAPTPSDAPFADRLRSLLDGTKAGPDGQSPAKKAMIQRIGEKRRAERTAETLEQAVAYAGLEPPPTRNLVTIEATDTIDRLIPRPQLMEALAHSDNPQCHVLANYMLDPQHEGKTLWALCVLAELSPAQLLVAFRDYKLAEGLVRLSMRTPKILEDVARDAESARIPCTQCFGDKVVQTPEGDEIPCVACFGTGELVRQGSKEARELVFDAINLRKSGGVNLNINQQFVTPAAKALPPMSDFSRSIQEAVVVKDEE